MTYLSEKDKERLRELLESSRSSKKKCKLNPDELKEEIIKEQQRIDREQMRVLNNKLKGEL